MRKVNDKFFEGHVLRPESHLLGSEGLTYYYALYKDSGIKYCDCRTLLLKYDGRIGTGVGGFSPVEGDYRDFPKYIRIPIAEAAQDAFEIFTDYFQRKTDIGKKVWFHELKSSEGEAIRFTFWNEDSDHAFLVSGFEKDENWGKDFFQLEKGKFKSKPTATSSGVAKAEYTKWIVSKNAELVDSEKVLEKIYPFMRERINNLFTEDKKGW
jgi:hypothetical protein